MSIRLAHRSSVNAHYKASAPALMPVGDLPGWSQTYAQDFNTDAPIGQIASFYDNNMRGYDGVNDTSGNGLYKPDNVLSVHDSMLDWFVHTGGVGHEVATPTPFGFVGQTYGKFSYRIKSDPLPGYKIAFLLFPETRTWTDEIDMSETNLDGTGVISSFVHDPSNLPNNIFAGNSTVDITDGLWHVCTCDWTPNGVSFYVDGFLTGTSAYSPSQDMYLALQLETQLNKDSSGAYIPPLDATSGHFYMDWLTVYAYVPAVVNGPGPTDPAVKQPWKFGTVTEGLPSNVPIYKARTLQPSGALELNTMIQAMPAAGIIDMSGQEVNISSFSNGSSSGAFATKWRGLIGGISNGAFDNQLLVADHCMTSAIVAAIQAAQTGTSLYAAARMAGGTAPFYWMGVHMIGADQGQITETVDSSHAQLTPAPARYKGVDFDLSGTGSIVQNSLFEGVNSATGHMPPWEVGALDFRRSNGQILRRVEVSGILPVGSKSRPQSTTVDPYNRGWKRSGGIQFNADKSPRLTDVSLHDTLVSGLTFSIAGAGNNGSNNTEDIQCIRAYLENNANGFNFSDINNEVVLGPGLYDHCTFKSALTTPHIKIANNTGLGQIAPNIPTANYKVIEPVWSGGGAGAMFQMWISTTTQTSIPTVIKNGVTLTGTTAFNKDPTQFFNIIKFT